MDAKTAHHVHESPLSMTGVLAVLALLSAIGGFLGVPHFLAPQLPLPAVKPELHHLETPLVVVSVAIALAGLAVAAFFFGGAAERAARARARFAGLHRLLQGKYFIDELYDRAIGRPLQWLSERVFLGIGDRLLLDGSLNGLAALAQRAAGVLGRFQTGSLHLYAFLMLLGSVACLVWLWRHV
jgi:NADH-quinone oxidoreductase subunit L